MQQAFDIVGGSLVFHYLGQLVGFFENLEYDLTIVSMKLGKFFCIAEDMSPAILLRTIAGFSGQSFEHIVSIMNIRALRFIAQYIERNLVTA